MCRYALTNHTQPSSLLNQSRRGLHQVYLYTRMVNHCKAFAQYHVIVLFILLVDISLCQTTPAHMIGQLDKCLREASTLDGVLEFRSEHFWTLSFGKLVSIWKVGKRFLKAVKKVLKTVRRTSKSRAQTFEIGWKPLKVAKKTLQTCENDFVKFWKGGWKDVSYWKFVKNQWNLWHTKVPSVQEQQIILRSTERSEIALAVCSPKAMGRHCEAIKFTFFFTCFVTVNATAADGHKNCVIVHCNQILQVGRDRRVQFLLFLRNAL